MSSLRLSLALLALWSSAAVAQEFRLEFHSDEALSSCELKVTPPGLIKVHMVVTGQGGPVGGVSFRAAMPPCMRNAIWLGDVWQQPPVYAVVQNTQSPDRVDVVVDCAPLPPTQPYHLPVYLGSVWFYVPEVDACCTYGPTAPDNAPAPYLIMCSGIADTRTLTPRPVVINPNESCRCDLPLPTRESTWGSVKALYR